MYIHVGECKHISTEYKQYVCWLQNIIKGVPVISLLNLQTKILCVLYSYRGISDNFCVFNFRRIDISPSTFRKHGLAHDEMKSPREPGYKVNCCFDQ